MENIRTDSDGALWSAASSGNIKAEELLIKRYSVVVRQCTRPYFLVGGDSEDLIQEGMLGLLYAIRSYEPARDTSFKTYAERCIRNRVYSAIRAAMRFKHRPLNDSISTESDEIQTLSSGILHNPEELVITRELTEELKVRLADSLSKFEKRVLDYFLEGLSYSYIALKLRKPVKSVDNAVQRIRRKLLQ